MGGTAKLELLFTDREGSFALLHAQIYFFGCLLTRLVLLLRQARSTASRRTSRLVATTRTSTSPIRPLARWTELLSMLAVCLVLGTYLSSALLGVHGQAMIVQKYVEGVQEYLQQG